MLSLTRRSFLRWNRNVSLAPRCVASFATRPIDPSALPNTIYQDNIPPSISAQDIQFDANEETLFDNDLSENLEEGITPGKGINARGEPKIKNFDEQEFSLTGQKLKSNMENLVNDMNIKADKPKVGPPLAKEPPTNVTVNEW